MNELESEISLLSQKYGELGITKGWVGEAGWVFLIGDTNEFISFQFGAKRWDDKQLTAATNVLLQRNEIFKSKNRRYYKFIVPEKGIIYHEYLPGIFKLTPAYMQRPACLLTDGQLQDVYYLYHSLERAKSLGLTYFRGDTHPNWLGSYVIYREIVSALSETGWECHAIPLGRLQPFVSAYDGDVFSPLCAALQQEAIHRAGLGEKTNLFESLLGYKVMDRERRATKVDVPEKYKRAFSRETIITEIYDSRLPRCVVFRDSTAQYCIDFLAEHFSRCVFIWHGGHVIEDVIDEEQPDIIIHIMAERFVSSYPKALTTVKIADLEARASKSG